MIRSKVLRADALLLLLAMLWGSGFIAQKWGLEHVSPMTFVMVRLVLATAFLAPLLLIRRSVPAQIPTPLRKLAPMLIGVAVMVFLGSWLQQSGLQTTEAGTAGFITGLYVVFTPLLGLLIGYRVRAMTWLATLIAVAGLFLLTVAGRPVLNIGDLLILICAVAWGAQLLFVGWLAPRMDVILLTVIQLGGAACISVVATLIFEPIDFEAILAARWPILYTALVTTGLAFLIQVWAQQHAPPAHAAILISLESVFSVLFGWWMLSERLSDIQIIGCVVMFIAIIVAELKPPRQEFFTGQPDEVSPPPPEADPRSRGPA
ncbi:MAG: DMT family transporter [Phycisphaerales bacterium]|nr:DMT family transporter [Phycisphaerales bacterium]